MPFSMNLIVCKNRKALFIFTMLRGYIYFYQSIKQVYLLHSKYILVMEHTSQMASLIIRFITLSSLLFTAAQCLPYNNGMTVNSRYSYAGKYIINLNGLQLNNPSQYSIPYGYSYCVVSFGDLIMQATNYSMDIFVETGCSYFTVRTGSLNSISKLSVSYFSYSDFNINVNPFQYQLTSAINTNISKYSSRVVPINYADFRYYYYYAYGYGWVYADIDLRAMVFLNGFRVSSSSSLLTYSISLTAQLLPSNNQSKTVNVHISSNSELPTFVQTIAFTVFLHYTPKINHYNPTKVYSQTFSGSNHFQYSNDKHIMLPLNTFVGLTSLLISNQNQLSFQSQIADKNTISVVSPNYLSVTYIIAYSRWCSSNQPYYLYINWRYYFYGTCFKSCPSCVDYIGSNYCYSYSYNSQQQCSLKLSTEFWLLQKKSSSSQSTLLYSLIVLALIGISIFWLINLRRKSKHSTKRKRESTLIQNESIIANLQVEQLNDSNNNLKRVNE